MKHAKRLLLISDFWYINCVTGKLEDLIYDIITW